jgi:elongation factor P hydroxylase
MHQITDLIAIFERTFFQRYNTRLIKGNDEPIYLPANNETPYHQIVFAHGYFSSGLHELSHWLVAGEARRKLEDFGYWYCPDGRDIQKQLEFEKVEVKPQAIEWLLCTAAGFKFNVSVDNLNGEQTDRYAFQERVHTRVLSLLVNGVNERTETLLKALCKFYNTPWPLTAEQFDWQRPQ